MLSFASTADPAATPLHSEVTQAFVVGQPHPTQSETKDGGVIVTSPSPQNPVTPPATSTSLSIANFTRCKHSGCDDILLCKNRGNISNEKANRTTIDEKATLYDIPRLYSQAAADAATADAPIVFPYPPEALTFAQVAECVAALNRKLESKTADIGREKGRNRRSQSGLLAGRLSVVVGVSTKSASESGGGGAKIFIGGLKYQLLMGNKATIAWLVAVLTGGLVSLPESFITIHSKRKVVSVGKLSEGMPPVGDIPPSSNPQQDPNEVRTVSLPTGCASIFVPNAKDVDRLLSMHRRAFCGPNGVMITGASSKTEELIRRLSSIAPNNSAHRGPAHPIVIERASGSGRPTTAQPAVKPVHFGREGEVRFYPTCTPAVVEEGSKIQRVPQVLDSASHQQHSFTFLGYGLDTDQKQKAPYQSSTFSTPQTTSHAFVCTTSQANFRDQSPVLRPLTPQLSSGDVNLPRTLSIQDEDAMSLNDHEDLTHAHGSRSEQQSAYEGKYNVCSLRSSQLQLQSLLQSVQSLSHGNLTKEQNEIVSEQLRVVANLQHQLSIVQNLQQQQQQKNLFESRTYHGSAAEGAGGVVHQYSFSTPISTGKYIEETFSAHIHVNESSSSFPQVHVPAVSSSPHALNNPAFYVSGQPSFPYTPAVGFAVAPPHSVYNAIQTSPSSQTHISNGLGPSTGNLNLRAFPPPPLSGIGAHTLHAEDPTRIGDRVATTASNNPSIGLLQQQHIHYQHQIEAQNQHQRLQEQIRALGQHAASQPQTAGGHLHSDVHHISKVLARTFQHAAQGGGTIQISAPTPFGPWNGDGPFASTPFYHVPEQRPSTMLPTSSSISNPSGTLWGLGYGPHPPTSSFLPHGGMAESAYSSSGFNPCFY